VTDVRSTWRRSVVVRETLSNVNVDSALRCLQLSCVWWVVHHEETCIPNYEFIHRVAKLEATWAVERLALHGDSNCAKLNLHFMDIFLLLSFLPFLRSFLYYLPFLYSYLSISERLGQDVSPPASYSGGQGGSNLGPETSYLYLFFVVSLSLSKQMSTTASFHILSNSLFIKHPIIRSQQSELMTASLNKPQVYKSIYPTMSSKMAVFWVGKLLPDYMVLQPRRQPSSYSPPWEPQILLCLLSSFLFILYFVFIPFRLPLFVPSLLLFPKAGHTSCLLYPKVAFALRRRSVGVPPPVGAVDRPRIKCRPSQLRKSTIFFFAPREARILPAAAVNNSVHIP
jgi:hypothetical protein